VPLKKTTTGNKAREWVKHIASPRMNFKTRPLVSSRDSIAFGLRPMASQKADRPPRDYSPKESHVDSSQTPGRASDLSMEDAPVHSAHSGYRQTEMTLLPGSAGAASLQPDRVRVASAEETALKSQVDATTDSRSTIRPEAVAEKVYRLMQKDLILDR
jgi:hypothetical protein